MDNEQIVFVGEDGTPTGEVGPKLASHTGQTKLHLAFSCYIFRRSDNKLLLTQRALVKKVWPGVWTNSVCGHPMPGEKIDDAIRRRGTYELGIETLDQIRCIIPSYRYITPPYKGIVEHEFCPIYVAYTDTEVKQNPLEVESYRWLDWTEYVTFLHENPEETSYWAKNQYLHLRDIEPFVSITNSSLL